MGEFAIRQRQEQGHHHAEMNRQQQRHGRCVASGQQGQAREAGEKQQRDKVAAHRLLRGIALQRIARVFYQTSVGCDLAFADNGAPLDVLFFINAVSSAREVGCGVRPCLLSASLTPASFSTFTISVFQRSSKAAGVLDGATKAYQFSASNPG